MENIIAKEKVALDDLGFDSRYRRALDFFKRRAPVVFISQHYQYWEKHGFVQQSLARELVSNGVAVEWYDGADWRKPSIVKTWDSPLLQVSQLPCFPLRRLPIVESLNPYLQAAFLRNRFGKGRHPFIWIQSGLDERVIEKLPYVDVFSVFDDPYIHSPEGKLAEKAQLIVTQNDYSQHLFQKKQGRKVKCMFPPVEMDPNYFDVESEFELPTKFPKKVMGYVGSFFSDGFDLILFENFIKSFTDWGFLLCGRTDEVGNKKIQSWDKYKNFIYMPWVPRVKVGAIWRKINLNLMLYRPAPTTDGAFPVKFLEALYYRVPSITTAVPKTSSLEGVIPRLIFPDQLKNEAIKASMVELGRLDKLYQQFSREMCPKRHLIQVAESCLSYE